MLFKNNMDNDNIILDLKSLYINNKLNIYNYNNIGIIWDILAIVIVKNNDDKDYLKKQTKERTEAVKECFRQLIKSNYNHYGNMWQNAK